MQQPVEPVPLPIPSSPAQASRSASPVAAQPLLLTEGRLLPQAMGWGQKPLYLLLDQPQVKKLLKAMKPSI